MGCNVSRLGSVALTEALVFYNCQVTDHLYMKHFYFQK